MPYSSQTGKQDLIAKHHATMALPFLISKFACIGIMPKSYCAALCRHHCTSLQNLSSEAPAWGSLDSLWTHTYQSCCNKYCIVSSSRHGVASFQKKTQPVHHPYGPLYRRRLKVDGEPQCCPENVGNVNCQLGLRILYTVQKISQALCSTVCTFWLIHLYKYSISSSIWP